MALEQTEDHDQDPGQTEDCDLDPGQAMDSGVALEQTVDHDLDPGQTVDRGDCGVSVKQVPPLMLYINEYI